MTIKTLIASLFIFSLTQAVSQVTLDIKERHKPVPTFNFWKISENKDHLYNLGLVDKGEKSIYYIEKYNVNDLSLVYQKDLKICADDKAALVHPLLVPPVCFESNNQFLVFYNSYDEDNKTVKINVKTTNENGDVNSTVLNLISSKDINVQMDGMYWNLIGYTKPVISYYSSEDKKSIVIEVNSQTFRKIYSYFISDLFAGKSDHKEIDVKTLIETEKIVINKCFSINNTLCFSYTKKISNKVTDFGFAVLDDKTNSFTLKNLGLTTNDVFSVEYSPNLSSNKIFVSGYLRYPINAAKPTDIENSKVKLFNVQFNIKDLSFENKNEFDFLPTIAKYISVPKIGYGFIDKAHTPDQYLENMGLIENDEYYYSVSHLLFGRGPTTGIINPMGVSGPAQGGGGVTTVSRDILVSKFDKTGKLIKQYLLPRHTGFNTFAGSRSGAIYVFANRQRNFNYGLKGNDLHFFYLDNKNNVFDPSENYDPRTTDKCTVNNGALIHITIKNDKIEREVLVEKDHKCYFYSNQSIMVNNAVILDVESDKKNSEIGRVIIN